MSLGDTNVKCVEAWALAGLFASGVNERAQLQRHAIMFVRKRVLAPVKIHPSLRHSHDNEQLG